MSLDLHNHYANQLAQLAAERARLGERLAELDIAARRIAWQQDTQRSLVALLLRAVRHDRINPDLYHEDGLPFAAEQIEAWCEQAWTRAHPEDAA